MPRRMDRRDVPQPLLGRGDSQTRPTRGESGKLGRREQGEIEEHEGSRVAQEGQKEEEGQKDAQSVSTTKD